ncbi:transmembrane protein, putative [Rhizoctonia solani AG-3 Rhs1AP]|uniref:Transmembrane protein, putative n=2 Tax=Rhizoctonia solani AG-3 TaxID=1086053 RepID=A0A0A1UKA9_9AGAM|nr:transmembrane protein, putative [Rhizoctonia solani AG-3 Rhs1AP]KEP49643.1 putative transmembrane protein [Rhizoctonia solani 123E]
MYNLTDSSSLLSDTLVTHLPDSAMLTFSRITNLVVFLLVSLSLVCVALPTPSSYSEERDSILVQNAYPNNVLDLLIDLEGKMKAPMRLISETKSYPEVRAQVEVIVAHLETCNDAVLAASERGQVDESMKAEIASKVASIISMTVQACLEVSLRLGWFLVFGIFAKLDICLKALITNLGTCGEGLVALIAKRYVEWKVGMRHVPSDCGFSVLHRLVHSY